jgi:hypothetical protein
LREFEEKKNSEAIIIEDDDSDSYYSSSSKKHLKTKKYVRRSYSFNYPTNKTQVVFVIL